MTRYKQEMAKRGELKTSDYKKDNTTRNSLIVTSVVLILGVLLLWIVI